MNDTIYLVPIATSHQALELMDKYLLISKTLGMPSVLYAKSKDKILVINSTRKYYITQEDFIKDFSLSSYYIYKSLDEIEIDQEFRNLRQ